MQNAQATKNTSQQVYAAITPISDIDENFLSTLCSKVLDYPVVVVLDATQNESKEVIDAAIQNIFNRFSEFEYPKVRENEMVLNVSSSMIMSSTSFTKTGERREVDSSQLLDTLVRGVLRNLSEAEGLPTCEVVEGIVLPKCIREVPSVSDVSAFTGHFDGIMEALKDTHHSQRLVKVNVGAIEDYLDEDPEPCFSSRRKVLVFTFDSFTIQDTATQVKAIERLKEFETKYPEHEIFTNLISCETSFGLLPDHEFRLVLANLILTTAEGETNGSAQPPQF